MLDNDYSIKNEVQPQPVSPGERIFALDVIRGFALFGVLLAYALWNLGSPGKETYSQTEITLNWVLEIMFDTKAYTLLATLFGLGFSIQMIRLESRGGSFVPVYCRRLLALMAIGLAHAFLLRNGDILVPYAAMGFVLLLFRKASNKMLLAGAIFALIFPYLAQAVLELSGGQLPKRPEAAGLNYLHENALWVFYWYKMAVFEWSQSLPMFFFGLYLGRRYFQQNAFVNPRKLGFFIIGGLVVGLLAYAGIEGLAVPEGQQPFFGQIVLTRHLWKIHAWGLAAFYASGLIWLSQYASWRRRLAPLAAVGRMALTNYILQAVLIVPFCIHFKLFDKVTPGTGLMLTLAVWILQVPFSIWWLTHFRFGPAEWLWRTLTYGRIQPMQIIEEEQANAVTA